MDPSQMRGKGAKIFAKRQQRMEKYTYSEPRQRFPPPSHQQMNGHGYAPRPQQFAPPRQRMQPQPTYHYPYAAPSYDEVMRQPSMPHYEDHDQSGYFTDYDARPRKNRNARMSNGFGANYRHEADQSGYFTDCDIRPSVQRSPHINNTRPMYGTNLNQPVVDHSGYYTDYEARPALPRKPRFNNSHEYTNGYATDYDDNSYHRRKFNHHDYNTHHSPVPSPVTKPSQPFSWQQPTSPNNDPGIAEEEQSDCSPLSSSTHTSFSPVSSLRSFTVEENKPKTAIRTVRPPKPLTTVDREIGSVMKRCGTSIHAPPPIEMVTPQQQGPSPWRSVRFTPKKDKKNESKPASSANYPFQVGSKPQPEPVVTTRMVSSIQPSINRQNQNFNKSPVVSSAPTKHVLNVSYKSKANKEQQKTVVTQTQQNIKRTETAVKTEKSITSSSDEVVGGLKEISQNEVPIKMKIVSQKPTPPPKRPVAPVKISNANVTLQKERRNVNTKIMSTTTSVSGDTAHVNGTQVTKNVDTKNHPVIPYNPTPTKNGPVVTTHNPTPKTTAPVVTTNNPTPTKNGPVVTSYNPTPKTTASVVTPHNHTLSQNAPVVTPHCPTPYKTGSVASPYNSTPTKAEPVVTPHNPTPAKTGPVVTPNNSTPTKTGPKVQPPLPPKDTNVKNTVPDKVNIKNATPIAVVDKEPVITRGFKKVEFKIKPRAASNTTTTPNQPIQAEAITVAAENTTAINTAPRLQTSTVEEEVMTPVVTPALFPEETARVGPVPPTYNSVEENLNNNDFIKPPPLMPKPSSTHIKTIAPPQAPEPIVQSNQPIKSLTFAHGSTGEDVVSQDFVDNSPKLEPTPEKTVSMGACIKLLDPSKRLELKKKNIMTDTPTLDAVMEQGRPHSRNALGYQRSLSPTPVRISRKESCQIPPKPSRRSKSESRAPQKPLIPFGGMHKSNAKPIGSLAEALRGRGAKIFEKQQRRMQRYTLESEGQAEAPNVRRIVAPSNGGSYDVKPDTKEIKQGMSNVLGQFQSTASPGCANRPSRNRKQGHNPQQYQQYLFYNRPPSAADFVGAEDQQEVCSSKSSEVDSYEGSDFTVSTMTTDSMDNSRTDLRVLGPVSGQPVPRVSVSPTPGVFKFEPAKAEYYNGGTLIKKEDRKVEATCNGDYTRKNHDVVNTSPTTVPAVVTIGNGHAIPNSAPNHENDSPQSSIYQSMASANGEVPVKVKVHTSSEAAPNTQDTSKKFTIKLSAPKFNVKPVGAKKISWTPPSRM